MATTKQIKANRNNAGLSTGPVTEPGKAIAAKNAVRHGILSREVLLKGEDETSLANFSEQLRAEIQPVGEVERLLVDRIIASAWRLRRLISVEVCIFHQEMESWMGEKPDVGLAFTRDANGADAFSRLSRYEAGIERSMYRALHELREMRSEHMGKTERGIRIIEVVRTPDEPGEIGFVSQKSISPDH
jgi:hypothetical protein